MDRREFAILFDGEELREGRMDVRQLAPALLAVGDLCQRANRLLNEDRTDVTVRVLAEPRKGSFQVILEFWQNVPEPARQLIGEYVAANAQGLLVHLGMAIDTAGKPGIKSLFEFLKILRGLWPPPKVEDNPDGQTKSVHIRDQISATDQAVVTVNNNTYILASDREVRRHIDAVLAPLRAPGIDTFKALDSGQVASEVSDKEVPYFEPPALAETKATLSEGESERTVEVEAVPFREDLKWRFKTGEGGDAERFTATMADPVFLARLDSRQEQFAKGDVMQIQLRTRDVETPRGIKSEHEVVRVVDHRPPARQLPLLDE